MRMCSKQKIRKTAFILLLATLISLIPSNTFRVLADGDIVPPFPYDELQTIGENDYVLFKVHGVEQVDYIEVFMPRINAHGNFQHLCPGLSYSNLGGWVLQINSIDYYFKDGQSVYFDLQSLFTTSFMPVENDDNYFPAWLEFVYTTEEIWGIDEDSNQGRGLKWFKDQNFIIPPAATPTPTPEPDVQPTPLAELPTFINNSDDNSLDLVIQCTDIGDNSSLEVGKFYAVPSQAWQYYNSSQSFSGNTFKPNCAAVWNDNSFWFNSIDGRSYTNIYEVEYNSVTNTLSSRLGLKGYTRHFLKNVDIGRYNYNMYGNVIAVNRDFVFNGASMTFDSSLPTFDLIAANSAVYVGSSGVVSTPTPTPTTAPTPIPQPSTTPEPEDPDSNSSWGWGIVNTLRYIFIPDKNKLIRLEKTAQTKFQQFGGGYDDLKRVSGFEDPVRPQNVVFNWQPFGTDSPEDQQQITLVDFEQIDFYLFQTSSGMFIKDCLSASFTFLMFGYLIHVIRKHFVIENTDDNEKGGGD